MKKLFTLAAAVLASFSLWAYAPEAEEVIILNDVYSASAAESGYSTHEAVAWAGTASSNSKKAGDPANDGEATASNVPCYSTKGNGGGKNITLNLSGCASIIVYHEKHSSRFIELRNGGKTGDLIAAGEPNTYFTAVELDPNEAYSIFLHGTDANGGDQDFTVYALKLIPGEAGPVVTYSVTYKPNGAAGEDIIFAEAQKVAANLFEVPEGFVFDGWNTAADGSGEAFAPGAKLESDLVLFAQWREITVCANIIPATEGVAPTEVGVEIDLDVNSEGGKIFVAGMKTPGESFVYSSYGLGFMKGGADSVRVEFNNYIVEGSIITLNIVANGTSERGLKLQSVAKSTLFDAKWTPAASGELNTFEYVVPAGSPLIGDYRILLARNNSVFLQNLTLANCGDEREGIIDDDDPVLNVSKSSVDLNLTAAAPSAEAVVTFSGKHLEPGTYNLALPEVAGMSVSPVSVTVNESGVLNQAVTIAFASDADVAAASAELSLTIGELSKSVVINYSATMAMAYLNQSINIEQLVLDNGKGYDIQAAFAAANIEFNNIDALDSLNDDYSKTARNYAFLGLKLKKADAKIACWLQAGATINIKFGNVGADFKVRMNGAEQTLTNAYANITPEDNNVFTFAAETDTYLEIVCNSTKTLVIKQIMLNEPLAAVTLPEPSVFTVTCADAENGSVSLANGKKQGSFAPGDVVELKFAAAEGYIVAHCFVNGEEIHQSAPLQPITFVMPAAAAEVVAEFALPTALDNTDAKAGATKVIRNGQLFILKNGTLYNAQGAVVE